jgi:hypothetical protein
VRGSTSSPATRAPRRKLDRELNLEEPEYGRRAYLLGCRDLKAAGVNPADATDEQLAAAMAPYYEAEVIA